MLIDEKNFEMVEQRERTRITQSGKNCAMNCAFQGVHLISKQKIWLAICEFLFCDFPVNQFNFKFLHSISTLCTNFIFLHSKNFKFLHCLGLIDLLSGNQHGEIFSCILLTKKSCPSFSTNEKQTYLCMRKHFTLHVLHALSDARPTHFARVSLLFLVLNLPST